MSTPFTYPVMERFPTLQGEGAWTGHASWFIRLGGCDVGCSWCDVKESWPVEAHPRVDVDTLVQEAVDSGLPRVVVTGGEPAMHDLGPLTAALQDAGLATHLRNQRHPPRQRRLGLGHPQPQEVQALLGGVVQRGRRAQSGGGEQPRFAVGRGTRGEARSRHSAVSSA